MATGKKSALSKAAKKVKPAPKAKAKAKSTAKPKPAAKKPAAKPAKKSAPAKAVKPAKAAPKPAPKASGKPVKPLAKAAAKPVAKAAAKGAPKPVARVVGKPAVKGPVKPLPPAKPVKTAPPRLVPATAEAKAAARVVKTASGKPKLVNRPVPEVRPLGVLPPESQARPKFTAPVRPVTPARVPSRHAAPVKPGPKKGDERLTPEDYKHFEQRLMTERAKIMREMGHLESTLLKVNPRDAAGELSGYSFHMADAGTDSMEREKAFDIASKEGRLLMEIKDALLRLYNGTYGICEVSGKTISRARLEALPWARLSLEEQEKMEKEQRAGRAPVKEE